MAIFALSGMIAGMERDILVLGGTNTSMKEPRMEWDWNGHQAAMSTTGNSKTTSVMALE